MKKNALYSIVSLLLAALLCGCEKELDFDNEGYSGISVFGLAVVDQPFKLRVSQSFTVNTNPSYVFSTDYQYYEEMDSIYLSSIVLPDAEVALTVNGTEHYDMKYNAGVWPFEYICDYVPQVGDHLEVHARSAGFPDVTMTQDIPKPASIEVVSTQVKYSEQEFPKDLPISKDFIAEDSVMEIRLRIHDDGSSRDFYRLIVRGVADGPGGSGEYYRYLVLYDVFESNDIIFTDYQLTKPYGMWPAKFSNVFDDHIFNGEDYDVTVQTRKRKGKDPYVFIELQSISQDLYFFLKSYMIYRISTDDVYTTPIGLHSNVDNGFGILGAVSYDRHIIYY